MFCPVRGIHISTDNLGERPIILGCGVNEEGESVQDVFHSGTHVTPTRTDELTRVLVGQFLHRISKNFVRCIALCSDNHENEKWTLGNICRDVSENGCFSC